MNLLSDEEIALAWIGINDPIALGGNFKDSEHVKNFAANLEAAVLAKLASAELPEPVVIDRHESGIVIRGYTAAQLQQAHAQGFAAGAAAQLAEKPSAFQLRDEEASEHYGREIYVLYSVFDFKDGANIGNIEKVLTPLYTRREA